MGTLGAAWITPMALIEPAAEVPEVEIMAVAARDPERARAFADQHGIPTVHPSYEALIADPSLDALYVPLPNSHHCEWTLRALAAGKHVLVEKPFTANADEARRIAATAEATGLVVMEAFHWRYHPQAHRMLELVDSGAIGEVRHVHATMLVPSTSGPDDIRLRYDLAGGITMDVGSYATSTVRAFGELDVVSAQAELHGDQVDRHMTVELRYREPLRGVSASIECGFTATDVVVDVTGVEGADDFPFEFHIDVMITGTQGRISVDNPLAPKWGTGITVTDADGHTISGKSADPITTYLCQLRAFLAAVRGDRAANLTPPSYSVANMEIIDAIYRAAGLKVRGAG